MQNEWKPIAGYEGRYLLASTGEVKSLKNDRILRPVLVAGYPTVTLYREGGRTTRKRYFVHRLVAAAFIGPCPDGHQVNHKDGVKSNPDLANLEYVTASGNAIHAFQIGLRKGSPGPWLRGEAHYESKLTDEKVRELRTSSEPIPVLAKRFGVTTEAIRQAKKGRTWRHVA